MSAEPERERFEKWATDKGIETERLADGRYAAYGADFRWQAWQAALSAQPAPQPVAPDDIAADQSHEMDRSLIRRLRKRLLQKSEQISQLQDTIERYQRGTQQAGSPVVSSDGKQTWADEPQHATEPVALIPREPTDAMIAAVESLPGAKTINDVLALHQIRTGATLPALEESFVVAAWRAMYDAALPQGGKE